MVTGLIVSGAVSAASVSYYLDQSNEDVLLPDGTNYLQVTIADGVGGDIDVTVDILQPLLDIAGVNFGIQSFGFNTTSGTFAGTVSGPSGWSTNIGMNESGFGNFVVVASGDGSNRQSPTLSFSISGIVGDTPADYAAFSTGNAGQGNQYFVAHVADFLDQDPGAGDVTSAYFAGSTAVPVPAAAWLFGSALGLLGWARRKRT